ncbi:uncharacterized protein LOC134905611 [Pseudophryne corroboree]|uniref:uncharacterized protein LOC134905611 n=1 Tax=Pseudophryne corroboree TaxID=495146 RepID=UPI0030814AC3
MFSSDRAVFVWLPWLLTCDAARRDVTGGRRGSVAGRTGGRQRHGADIDSTMAAPPSIRFVPSRRRMLLNIDGYLLAKNKQRGNVVYWHCTEKVTGPCSCYAKTTIMAGEHQLNTHGEHNHAPKPEKTDVAIAKDAIKRRARDTNDSPSQIIQSVTSDMPSTSAPCLPNRESLRQLVKRARREDCPPEPTSLDDIDVPEHLANIDDIKFLGKDSAFHNKRNLLFSTEANLKKLHEACCWVMDGTFKTCPTLFRQIYSIHAMVGTDETTQRFVPLVYGLLSSKSEDCYTCFFEDLQDYALEYDIKFAPLFILTDFENAAIQAAKRVFLGSTHKCCLFHLGQNIWRKIQSFVLATQYGHDHAFSMKLRHLQALAFLPSDEIPPAFESLKSEMPTNAAPLMNYFEDVLETVLEVKQDLRLSFPQTCGLFTRTCVVVFKGHKTSWRAGIGDGILSLERKSLEFTSLFCACTRNKK